MGNDNHKELLFYSRDLEDVFGSYLLEGAKYDGEYDIPFMNPVYQIDCNINVVSYSNINEVEDRSKYLVHFYQKDYVFDGVYGIWNALLYQTKFKKGFTIDKLKDFYGVICPDYSLYNDMPEILKIWNVYRSRVVGYYLNKLGILTIPNVRWTDSRSYKYCFAGLKKNTIVAVGTVGCLRANRDKEMFISGLEELIIRIHPKCIILYGNLTSEVLIVLNKYNQDYLFFPSQISEAMRFKYGNENK